MWTKFKTLLQHCLTANDNTTFDPHLVAMWIGILSYLAFTGYHYAKFDFTQFATGFSIITGAGGIVNKMKDWAANGSQQ